MENNNKLLINLLNLSEADIKDINSINQDGIVSVYITLNSDFTLCPRCNGKLKSKGYYDKKITISNYAFNNIKVYMHVKRLVCVDCHHSVSDSKHIGPRNKTISYSLINQVMELLKNPSMTFVEASRITGISPMSVERLFDRHCHIPKQPLPEVLCIDEVYTKNSSFNSKYSCIFYDFAKRQIIDVLPSRHKAYLHNYFQNYQGSNELDNVKYVCIDMYRPYKDIVQIYMKKAIICVDSFHVIKHLNDDLSNIRIRIMKKYDKNSIEYYLLKNFKYLLFKNNINLDNEAKYNKRLERYINLRQLLNLMLSIDQDLMNAYYIKQSYSLFNETATYETAETQLNNIIDSIIKANIPEYSEFLSILKNWKGEIINSFIRYKGKRINNSIAESINSRIQTVLYNSRGIRDTTRRRKRIMYAINKEGFTLR